MKINKEENDSIESLLSAEKSEKLDVLLNPAKVKYDFLQDAEDDEVIAEIDFDALVDLSQQNLGTINREKFGEENDTILFYCKDCKKETEVSRLPNGKQKKIQFRCSVCNGGNVIYGTTRGVKEYYERRNKA